VAAEVVVELEAVMVKVMIQQVVAVAQGLLLLDI
jgi:hypothetical protein